MSSNDELDKPINILGNTNEEQKEDKKDIPKKAIGLDIDELRNIVFKVHNEKVDRDDPILINVTILNEFLKENDKLNKQYNETLKKIYTEQTQKFLDEIANSSKGIEASLKGLSVEALDKVYRKNTIQLVLFRNNIMWASAVIAVSALINACVFVLRSI